MRVFLVILDGMGVGPAPDWAAFNATGGATLPAVAHALGGLRLPTFEKLGLGRIASIDGVAPSASPQGAFGRAAPLATGCDTLTGIRELLGDPRRKRCPVYPDGLPAAAIAALSAATGFRFMGNVHARHGRPIVRFGAEHLQRGEPFAYVASEGVVVIAAHEDVVPIAVQHSIGERAIAALWPHGIVRVVVRPFRGAHPNFVREPAARREFAAPLTGDGHLLTRFGQAPWVRVVAAPHVAALLRGTHDATVDVLPDLHTDADQLAAFLDLLDAPADGDLVALFCLRQLDEACHARDLARIGALLEQTDVILAEALRLARPADLFVITADHGNDPVCTESGHTREFSPILLAGPAAPEGGDLGTRDTLADVAATIAACLALPTLAVGRSLIDRCVGPSA